MQVESFCNEFNCEGGLSYVIFPQVTDRPELWQVRVCDRNLLHILGMRPYRSNPTTLNMQEEAAYETVDIQIDSLEHDMVQVEMNDTDQLISEKSQYFGPHDNRLIREILTTHKHILNEIIFFLLCGRRQDNWSHLTTDILINDILTGAEQIFKQLTSFEIDGILGIFERQSTRKLPGMKRPKMKKLEKANLLAFILGQTKRYFRPRKQFKQIPRLTDICKLEVARSVPDQIMRVGLALWKFKYDLPEWMDKSPLPISLEIPVEPYSFDIISYPDICEERSQVESKIIDPSHCLTNLRVHATQKGFFNCDPKAFIRVSESDNKVLSRALLMEPLLDKQSVSFAQKVFSSEVEQTMCNNGDMKEAELVKNIRNWYDACNKRGMLLSERFEIFVTMHNYMLSFYNAEYFPMNTTHVCGLPALTYQAILHNISTRIQLYYLSATKTYNQRAVSTLAVETMFSALTTLSRTTSGIPLAAKIPRYISKMTQMTATQCNPEK